MRAARIMESLGPIATTIEGESHEAKANTPYTIPLLIQNRENILLKE